MFSQMFQDKLISTSTFTEQIPLLWGGPISRFQCGETGKEVPRNRMFPAGTDVRNLSRNSSQNLLHPQFEVYVRQKYFNTTLTCIDLKLI